MEGQFITMAGLVLLALSVAQGQTRAADARSITTGSGPGMISAANFIWKQWLQTEGGNDHWYGVRHGITSWSFTQTQEVAARIHSEVVTLQTEEELNAVMNLFANQFSATWLGLTRVVGSENFQWEDGSSLAYSRWAPGEPALAEQDGTAVKLDAYGKWYVGGTSARFSDLLFERTNSPAEIKPIIIGSLAPFQTIPGATNRLEFEVVAGPPFSYQWRHNGKDLPGETNRALTIIATNAAGSGDYTLAVSNSYGAAISSDVKVSVTSTPLVTIIATQVTPHELRLFVEQPVSNVTATMEVSYDLLAWYRREVWQGAGTFQSTDFIDTNFSEPPKFYRVRLDP